MNFYTKITFLENIRRCRVLEEFARLLNIYYSNIEYGYMSNDPLENTEAENARPQINLILHEARTIVLLTGVPITMTYYPAPAVGGFVQKIDLFLNFDNLRHYHIPHTKVFDILNQALGIYNRDLAASKIRTFNPFFWLGRGLGCISDLPFVFVGWLGFDKQKAKMSFLGRVFGGIFRLATFVAAVLTVLHLLGYLEPVKEFVDKKVVKMEPSEVVPFKESVVDVPEVANDPNSQENL